MSPQKWQEYLAAFRTFGQNASKYRNFPKDPKIKNGDIPHPAESQSVKASPEPPKGSVAAGFNTSRGASSTVFTYPESGKPVTNTAGTAPSTVSSKATKKDESELKYGSKQPVNGTSLGKTSKGEFPPDSFCSSFHWCFQFTSSRPIHFFSSQSPPFLTSSVESQYCEPARLSCLILLASTHKLFAPGSPPRSSFSKASTSRGPTASINFSTSTMQPTTPDRLANDCNNSVRSEIGSDGM